MQFNQKILSDNFIIDPKDLEEIASLKRNVVKASLKDSMYPVALKFTNLDENQIGDYVLNFKRLSGKSHNNVIHHLNIYRLDQSSGPFSVVEVLEYANHEPLSTFLQAPRKFSLIVDLFKQALNGYHFIHCNGILHRDIKASNILIHQNNNQYFAKVNDVEFWPGDQTGATKTTPEYLAPEVLTYSDYNVQSEMWAIGVMIYELFTGEFPFGSRLKGATIDQIRENTKNIEPTLFARIPPPFRKIAEKCLVKDPAKRLKSVEEIKRMLNPTSIIVDALKSKFAFN